MSQNTAIIRHLSAGYLYFIVHYAKNVFFSNLIHQLLNRRSQSNTGEHIKAPFFHCVDCTAKSHTEKMFVYRNNRLGMIWQAKKKPFQAGGKN